MFYPKEGQDERYYHVLYLSANGEMERRATEYTDGWLSFETSHFSDYVIVYDETVPNRDVKPVEMHRLYNPNAVMAGAHHYTIDGFERDYLVDVGWSEEGIAWYGM